MRLLCIDPGASYATGDVFRGFAAALKEQGHEILHYRLSDRIDQAARFLKGEYRRGYRAKPEWPEILTKATMEVIPQALYHQPDWVLVFSGMYFPPDFFILLKRAGMRIAIVLSESPYDIDKEARVVPWCDVAFTNERTSVAYLQQFNPNTHYLPHAFDPAVSNPEPPPADTPSYDVLFVGTLFEERVELLSQVDWTGINFAIYGAPGTLASRHRLRQYIKGGITDNRRAQDLYKAAKVNLNIYRTSRGIGRGVEHIAHAESLNPRALELAACGALQLSEYRAEMDAVFGRTITESITYGGPAHLEQVVREWLGIERGRMALARAMPQHVANHTYAHRARELTATLAAHGASREALAAD